MPLSPLLPGSKTLLLLVASAGLLALGWQMSTPAPVPQPPAPPHRAPGQPVAGLSAVQAIAPTRTSAQATQAAAALARLDQSLLDYQHARLTPEQKHGIQQALRQFAAERHNQPHLVARFFSPNAPHLAEALYHVMLAADLKDVGLLEQLIERDSRTPETRFSARIVDLIADLGQQGRYSAQIDGYLAQLTQYPDPHLRELAATRRLWYLQQHQPLNTAAQEKYLFDRSPRVREEVYSLLEARLANPAADGQPLPGQAQLATALQTALNAALAGGPDRASEEERSRLGHLYQALTAPTAQPRHDG